MSASESRKVGLYLYAQDQATEITVFDGPSRIVARGLGRLETSLDPGFYKVRATAGSAMWQELVALEPGQRGRGIEIPTLQFATPIPLPDTAQAVADHEAAAQRESRCVHVRAGVGSAIFLFVRCATAGAAALPGAQLVQGMALQDLAGKPITDLAGNPITDLAMCAVTAGGGDPAPWAACNIAVDPGIYRLVARSAGHEPVEQTLVAAPGWQTQVFALASDPGLGMAGTRADLANAAILYLHYDPSHQSASRAEEEYLRQAYSKGARLVELARLGLTDRRQVLPHDVTEMLWAKWRNPMLGILGAHLLLLRANPNLELLATVVRNLRRMLGRHPDVEALALKVPPDPAFPSYTFCAPPMLRRSWRLISEAAFDRPEILPDDSLALRAGERLRGEGPWHAWQTPPEAVTAAGIAESNSSLFKKWHPITQGPLPFSAETERAASLQQTERAVALQAQLRIMGYEYGSTTAGPKHPDDVPSRLTLGDDELRRLCYVLGIPRSSVEALWDEMSATARDYEAIRQREPYTWARTMKLERILQDIRKDAQRQDKNLVWWLANNLIAEDWPGNRVTALALLQVYPAQRFFPFVLDGICHWRSPFEQYHALVAAQEMVPLLDADQKLQLGAAIKEQQRSGGGIKRTTDRWDLSEEVLGQLRGIR